MTSANSLRPLEGLDLADQLAELLATCLAQVVPAGLLTSRPATAETNRLHPSDAAVDAPHRR